MADNLNQSIQELNETVKLGIGPWVSTIEELTKVTLRTGKEYGDGFKGLTDQFRGLDVALSDVKDMLGHSIRTGVSFEGTNKKLLIDLKRLGFNLGRFMDTMGTFEQVLGFSESTTAHLANSLVDFSVKFGRSAEQLASTMQSLVAPMAAMSNAYGGTAAAGFAESIIGLGAAMGPKIADQLGPVMAKFMSTDPEGFKRAALAGAGTEAMTSPQAMISMAQGMISRIDKLVTPGAPFSAGIAAQMFGLSQQDVNILRQLAVTNMSQLAVAEQNMAFEQAKNLASETFTQHLASITFELQTALLPVMDAINDSISLIFKVFRVALPDFADKAIEFGEFVGGKLREWFSEDNITGAFTAMKKFGNDGIKLWADIKEKFDGWYENTVDFFGGAANTLERWYNQAELWFKSSPWDPVIARMDAAFNSMETFFTTTAVALSDLMTNVFNEIDLRLSASQISSSQSGGMWGDDGWLAAMGGGGKFRQAAEQHKETESNLTPANFYAEPIAQNTTAQQTAGTAMFADPELLEQQKLLVEAIESQTEATNSQVIQLKVQTRQQAKTILRNASDFINENKPSMGSPGRLSYD